MKLRIILFFLLTVISSTCMYGREHWPDGSVMERWFTSGPKEGKKTKEFNICDFGAVSDSLKIQTAAIQKAIDAAAVKGGTVVVPEGIFCSGALFFKPGTSLRIEKGAVLKGSDAIADYPVSTVHIEGVQQEYVSALVNAYNADGFRISGSGTIDGNGKRFWEAFWTRRKENPQCTNLEVLRPRLIYVAQSSDVTIEGVRLKDPGFWTTHLYKCRRVLLRNLDIKAPVKGLKAPSSDAIDVDGCSMVHITGCDISVNDDFIALKGGKGPWADSSPDNAPDEKILIEDCVFGAGPHVLTFGSECFDARNVILRNSRVNDTRMLLRLKIRPDTPQRYSDILVENISGYTWTAVHIRPWTQFFDPGDRTDIPASVVSGLTLKGCRFNCSKILDIQCDSLVARIEEPRMENNRIFIINYDKKKTGDPSPADPLVFNDGRRVNSPEEWKQRRGEILEMFQSGMYGRMPEALPFWCDTLEQGSTLAGFAERKQVRMWFNEEHTDPKIDWMIITPKDKKGPYPVILTLNYYGNHSLMHDPEILVPDCWLDNSQEYCISGNRASEKGRGCIDETTGRYVYPIELMVARGWSFVTACYGDISADPEDTSMQAELPYHGCFELWGPRDSSRTDNTMALAAWAWGLSRGMDMIERDKNLDASAVLVTGCSRLGKAALIAGAFDERFKIVVPIQTGAGGVPLAKHWWGENIASETQTYTHWFCKAYRKYAGNEAALPFDQHMLLSCIAPRALLVLGFDNRWFDYEGEYMSVQAASPVWQFLGAEGLPDVPCPKDFESSAIGSVLGYARRSHGHGISMRDWLWMLDFAERQNNERNLHLP